ncbi:MAG: hypothetical protein UT13_C0001G0821 [Candidatus Pacebacteria bacterium GW2011_GWF2_38_9]|nr:MAG: hypothetical protein US01_C0001G0856 [candidate division TM6 bacterium GW2011_GWF2_28_16]KKQ07837.1 MAG: hypothetical protein US20_C0028G0016 [Candidatus Pacebacteria bacterium GW2011_GWF1_36_5]KKQ89173.1 MAG: hypothetical protein UT13_C0001G0821 [Candidatus Pacebacteria bacterium GW2011_GWF2_38_9]
MYDLKICLRNGVDLFVIYDRQNKEIIISLYINGMEVATTEAISVEKFSLNEIREDLGLVLSDVSAWLSVVDNNSNFEKSTVWERKN